MSRGVKKVTRITAYLFFLTLTFVVSSTLSLFQSKKSTSESNSLIPPIIPTAQADTPACGSSCATDGGQNSSACAGGSCACGAACDCSTDGSGGTDGGGGGGNCGGTDGAGV